VVGGAELVRAALTDVRAHAPMIPNNKNSAVTENMHHAAHHHLNFSVRGGGHAASAACVRAAYLLGVSHKVGESQSGVAP
jgi:hypothetical protein